MISESMHLFTKGFNAETRIGLEEPRIHTVSIKDLIVDGSPRLAGIDNAHVVRLAERIGNLPPIVVHRQTMRVIDGVHRLQAAMRHGLEVVDVSYFDGEEDAAFMLGVELNIRHGLPLSLHDRKAAARRILATACELSDRAIALKTGLSDKTIAAIRVRSAAEPAHPRKRRGRDGRTYPIDAADGRRRAAQLLAERPEASLREIAAAAGTSPGTVSDVRKKLSSDRRTREPQSEKKADIAKRSTVNFVPPYQNSRRTLMKETEKKQLILERLRSDPSVRTREAGRELLRWLYNHVIEIGDLPDPSSVPPHRATLVAALAREAANAWSEFARRLEA